jgi:mannose-6-phosphate isomerase-like protein (cupin superfamily)
MKDVSLYKSGLRLRKPWGIEILIGSVPGLELWELRMEPGSATSLHLHANKHTGLVTLSGNACLVLASGAIDLAPGDSHFIAAATPHRIVAREAVVLWELESPPDKEDIQRLDDRYGREGRPFLFGTSVLPPRVAESDGAKPPQKALDVLLAMFAARRVRPRRDTTMRELADDILEQATRNR